MITGVDQFRQRRFQSDRTQSECDLGVEPERNRLCEPAKQSVGIETGQCERATPVQRLPIRQSAEPSSGALPRVAFIRRPLRGLESVRSIPRVPLRFTRGFTPSPALQAMTELLGVCHPARRTAPRSRLAQSDTISDRVPGPRSTLPVNRLCPTRLR